MKQTLLILCLIFLLIGELSAKRITILGTYINNNKDTVNCKFLIPMVKGKKEILEINFVKIQKKIKVLRLADNEKLKLTPKSIKGYEFGYEYHHYQLYSKDIGLGQKRK